MSDETCQAAVLQTICLLTSQSAIEGSSAAGIAWRKTGLTLWGSRAWHHFTAARPQSCCAESALAT